MIEERRRAVTSLIAFLFGAALIVGVPSVSPAPGSASAAIARSPRCAARMGATLAGSAQLRVFSGEGADGLHQVFVCSKTSGETRPLGLRSARVGRPIALSGPWAAAVEERGKAQDELLRDVIARDIDSRSLNICRIGLANRPGQLITVSSLVVTSEGGIGWSGREKLYMAQPVVGACIEGRDQILARGPGLALKSLELSGDTLTWSNEEHQESFRFD